MVIIKCNDQTYLYDIIGTNFTGKVITNSSSSFLKNGYEHRYYGPAEFCFDYKYWWWQGEELGCFKPNNNFFVFSQKQFLKKLNKICLK